MSTSTQIQVEADAILLSGRFTKAKTAELKQYALDFAGRPDAQALVVDLRLVEHLDPLVIQLLLCIKGDAERRGNTFSLRNTPAWLDDILDAIAIQF